MKNAKEFLIHLLSDDTLFSDTLCSLLQHPEKLSEEITKSGYQFTPEELKIALADLQNEDLRVWGGLYRFTAPGAMKNKQLKIIPQTGQMFVDLAENITTTTSIREVSAKGNCTFSWIEEDKTITITFYANLDANGNPLPVTFSGTLTGKDSSEAVTGKQIVDTGSKALQDWFFIGEISAFTMLLGIPLTFYSYYQCCKKDTTPEILLENYELMKESVKAHTT